MWNSASHIFSHRMDLLNEMKIEWMNLDGLSRVIKRNLVLLGSKTMREI